MKQIEPNRQERKAKRELQTLEVGDVVIIQNQAGNKPLKWSKTGSIVEVRPNRQYKVLIEGSHNVTLRNRKFLKKVSQNYRKLPYAEDPLHQLRQPQLTPKTTTTIENKRAPSPEKIDSPYKEQESEIVEYQPTPTSPTQTTDTPNQETTANSAERTESVREKRKRDETDGAGVRKKVYFADEEPEQQQKVMPRRSERKKKPPREKLDL